MANRTSRNWLSGLGINLVSNLIAIVVGGVVTYFSHAGSAWVKPTLFGAGAWLLTFCSILAFRVMKSLPPKVEPITTENVGHYVRNWLDKFNLTVKSVHTPGSHFYYIVTTDGGKKVSVSRNIDPFSDYLTFQALVTLTDEEKEILKSFNDDEKLQAILDVKLELSRAVVGYKSDDMLAGFTMFKQIPIGRSLSEREVIGAVWEMEALVGSVLTINSMTALRFRLAKSGPALANI